MADPPRPVRPPPLHHVLATVPVGIIQRSCTAARRAGGLIIAHRGRRRRRLGRAVARAVGPRPHGRWRRPTLTAAFDAGIDGLLDGSAQRRAGARRGLPRGFAGFMYTATAHAGPNEWEMRSPTWETEPELALAAIDRMRLSPDSASPESRSQAQSAERARRSARSSPRRSRAIRRRRRSSRAALRSARASVCPAVNARRPTPSG